MCESSGSKAPWKRCQDPGGTAHPLGHEKPARVPEPHPGGPFRGSPHTCEQALKFRPWQLSPAGWGVGTSPTSLPILSLLTLLNLGSRNHGSWTVCLSIADSEAQGRRGRAASWLLTRDQLLRYPCPCVAQVPEACVRPLGGVGGGPAIRWAAKGNTESGLVRSEARTAGWYPTRSFIESHLAVPGSVETDPPGASSWVGRRRIKVLV